MKDQKQSSKIIDIASYALKWVFVIHFLLAGTNVTLCKAVLCSSLHFLVLVEISSQCEGFLLVALNPVSVNKNDASTDAATDNNNSLKYKSNVYFLILSDMR